MLIHRSPQAFGLALTFATWAAAAPPTHVLSPARQVSIAESGAPAAGTFGLGRAPKAIRQFRGRCNTYVQFRLPAVPEGQAFVRGVLRLHADYVSSSKYAPRAWAAIVAGELPQALTWESQPETVELTRTRAVEVKERGPFQIEVREGLQAGQAVTFRVLAGGGGYRWLWWRESRTPRLELWTAPASEVISVMAASRDVPFPPDRELPSLLPAWRKLKTVPILQYFWPRTNDETRDAWLTDYLEMGFTGTYKSDGDPPHGGRLFLEGGMHGFMPQSAFANRGEPVLGPDGTPAPFPIVPRLKRRHPYCNSIFSPRNREAYYAYLIRFSRDYGLDNLFRVGDTVVLSSWDETGLYSRKFMEYGYTAKEEFAAYLRDVAFGDTHPNRDSNRDGRTLNRDTGLSIEDWASVPLPRRDERFDRPGLWRHFVDFHGYYTYRFFRRGSLVLSKAFRREAELFPFSHATAKWVGRSSQIGLDLYWQSKLNRILTVEDCQADYPGSNIHYAFTDQLSRRYGLPVMGWSWWWPEPERSTDPLEFGRALSRAMGHNCHGLNFWVYGESWAKKPAARAACAHWHRVFQAHWDFLRNATVPRPPVAIVRSRNTANMYPGWEYPKIDHGWTVAALTEAHIPFEIIAGNQVEFEPDILGDYKVLLIPTATWESPRLRSAIASFLERGGYVFTNGDSFMLDNVTGQTTDFLTHHFAISPTRKHKGLFAPTYDTRAEYEWARDQASKWQTPKWDGAPHEPPFVMKPLRIEDSGLATLRDSLPGTSGTGLSQHLLDPRKPHLITSQAGGLPSPHRTFHDVITGEVQSGGTAVATYEGKVCAVETARTLWTGFRPGFDHACIFPLKLMRKWGEPVWPFHRTLSRDGAGRAAPRQWITRIVKKAGIKPWLDVSFAGKRSPHIEILPRRDDHGNALIFVINHEDQAGTYQLAGELLAKSEALCEVRSGTRLERREDGKVSLAIPTFDVAIIAAGVKPFVAARLAAHQAIGAQVKPMPLSVRRD